MLRMTIAKSINSFYRICTKSTGIKNTNKRKLYPYKIYTNIYLTCFRLGKIIGLNFPSNVMTVFTNLERPIVETLLEFINACILGGDMYFADFLKGG